MVIYTLAQFPLSMVVYPGETIPLHIFEPRYRDLINDCRALDVPFGIVAVIDQQVMEIGTKVVFNTLQKQYSDGRMDISVVATGTYRPEDFRAKGSKSYPEGDVEDLQMRPATDVVLEQNLLALVQELYEVMQIAKPVGLDDFYSLVHKLSFTIEEEYQLLAMPGIDEQRHYMVSKLKKLIPQIKEAEEVRKRISMNGQYQHHVS